MNKELRKKKKERRDDFAERNHPRKRIPYSLFLIPNSKSGFTLLFASLIVSLLLSVGLAILNITLQEYILSSAGKESQFAFYNADTGVECALYYDKKGPGGKTFLIPPSDPDSPLPTYLNDNPMGITCANAPAFGYSENGSGNTAVTTFNVILDSSQCPTNPGETISVTVTKTYDPAQQILRTDIKSRGYNTCDLSNTRRVERGLQADY